MCHLQSWMLRFLSGFRSVWVTSLIRSLLIFVVASRQIVSDENLRTPPRPYIFHYFRPTFHLHAFLPIDIVKWIYFSWTTCKLGVTETLKIHLPSEFICRNKRNSSKAKIHTDIEVQKHCYFKRWESRSEEFAGFIGWVALLLPHLTFLYVVNIIVFSLQYQSAVSIGKWTWKSTV